MTTQRLLMVTDKYAPHTGGSAVVMSNWCNCWAPSQVRVVTSLGPGALEYDSHHGLKVERCYYPDIPKIRMPLLWLTMWLKAVRACITWRPTVLHFGEMLGSAFLAPWVRHLTGIPYILNIHGEELTTSLQTPQIRRHYQDLLASAAGVTANSQFTAGLLKNEFAFRGPLLIVHPGVDTKRFQPGDRTVARHRMGLSDGPVLLTVARLIRRKGHDLVLRSLSNLIPRYPDLQYLIVGDGPERGRLERIVEESGLKARVRILGKLPDSELLTAYQAADIFVHPNRQLQNGDVEGFGIVFLEAGACGIPVIGGRSGGTADSVRNYETGFLIDTQSHEELTLRLEELLENRDLAAQLGKNGCAFAAKHDWPAAAREVWEFSSNPAGYA